MTRDFLTAWVLPVAILLPPVYAMIAPIPLQVLHQFCVHKGVTFRRVFTAASISLAYGAASLLFRAFPDSFAGHSVGTGTHALTWVLAVALCELVGGRGHHFMIVGAIKLTDPSVRIRDLELDREALQADFAEFDLSVLITVVIAVNPVLAIAAVPTVLLARRFIMHAQLLAASRIDTKTGLLNSSTWEREAEAEVTRPSGWASRWLSRWSTSTISRWSTTPTATWPGTRRFAPSPMPCAASCAATTWPAGSAARSSLCCCRRPARTRSTWPSASARTSPGWSSQSTTRTRALGPSGSPSRSGSRPWTARAAS